METKIKIAIIDNGVKQSLLSGKLKNEVVIKNDNTCVNDNTEGENDFLHGTICAKIIEKFAPNCGISSIRVLDKDGMGCLDKLKPALEWCLKERIDIVNLSLGTTNFKDKGTIQKLVNYYTNRGLHIIAASANDNYITYPASFSNVIGVAVDYDKKINDYSYCNLGIDVMVKSEYNISLYGNEVTLPPSNSYAAPYVSAMIGSIFSQFGRLRISEIKRKLKNCDGIIVNSHYFDPDWINAAFLLDYSKNSCADFYFNIADRDMESIPENVDTVIVNSLSEIKRAISYDKHMVYLGKEEISIPNNTNFFWKWSNKLNQICQSKICEKKLEIPMIICEFHGEIDEMLFLCQIKNNFYKEGYNLYPVSLKTECVLYGLEYIPEEVLVEENKIYFNSFIFWETYYKQSDILLFAGGKECIKKVKNNTEEADIYIKIVLENQKYNVIFWCDDIIVNKYLFEDLYGDAMQVVCNNIIKLLEEECE